MNNLEPRLLLNIRAALSKLYGLGDKGEAEPSMHSVEAHSYLMRFQSRNLRRKIQSLQQSERDSVSQDRVNESVKDKIHGIIGDDFGSIFLTCIAVLSRPHLFKETEKIFCAQTLLSRIRRMPTYQAIDLEFEHETTSTVYLSFTLDYWKNLLTLYTAILSSYHPVLGHSMNLYVGGIDSFASTRKTQSDEERLKGDVSLIIVACLMLIQNHDATKSQVSNSLMPCHDPIISTLSAAMALFAFRLRCTLVYSSTQNIVDDSKYNVVNVVVEILDHTRTYFDFHPANFAVCVCSSLAAIPDAIFGSPGGARGRLSIDPKYVRRCYRELNDKRQGVDLVKRIFYGLTSLSHSWIGSKELSFKVDHHMLIVCERWAKFLTLPLEFLEMIIPLVERYFDPASSDSDPAMKRVVFSFFIRLYEGACMEAEEIHSMYLGLSSEQLDSSDQDGRKRPGSKSKRRLKERAESASSQDSGEYLHTQAEREALDRGEVACRTSVLIWSLIFKSVDSQLGCLNNLDAIDGEGEIGCLIACISACVPHIIEYSCEMKYPQLLQNLIWSIGKVCCSSSRYVRTLSLEIIERIHSALVTRTQNFLDMNSFSEFEKSIALFLCECSIQLAYQCAYPLNYFADMTEESDEDLENERNDVRDVLRSICDVENPGYHPSIISLLILENILELCLHRLNDTPIESAETMVHILSSLAKPVNWICTYFHSYGSSLSLKALNLTVRCFHKVSEKLLDFLSSSSPSLLAFPVIRLVSLAIASFSPTFNFVGMYLNQQPDEYNAFTLYYSMLGLSASVASLSLHKVPELYGDNSKAIITHLNIKGAMRAPGGEDHVSCIALMRLSFESDDLPLYWLDACAKVQGRTIDDILLNLLKIHDDLKTSELQRGPGIEHGQGVTPKTRRLLMNTISQLVLKLHGKIAVSDSIQSRVRYVFLLNYEQISHTYNRSDILTAEKMFHICEAVFDLASFPPDLICSSLSPTSIALHGFGCLVQMVLSGYCTKSEMKSGFIDLKVQWSRLRAGLFTFLQECVKITLPQVVADSLTAIIIAECSAITSLLYDNNENSSQLLLIDSISEETIFPCGAFLRVLADYFHIVSTKSMKDTSSIDDLFENMASVVLILTAVEKPIYSCLGSLHPETIKYSDPRPTLAESWFETLSNLIILMDKRNTQVHKFEHIPQLVFEAIKLTLQMMFFHEIDDSSTKHSAKGMSVDGPQIFSMMNFLQNACKSFGMKALTSIAISFKDEIRLDMKPVPEYELGGILLCGALFRAFSGSLPPWTIENAPGLYFSIFQACGTNMDFFHSIMVMGSEVKIKGHSSVFYNLRDGDKLGGHLVQSHQVQQLRSFLKTESDWRQLKALIKSACGGKKKSSSFANKPTSTTWLFDRI